MATYLFDLYQIGTIYIIYGKKLKNDKVCELCKLAKLLHKNNPSTKKQVIQSYRQGFACVG